MTKWRWLALAALLGLSFLGCASLDEKQREWIFQPGDRAWGGSAQAAQDMESVWINFDSKLNDQTAKLHGLWLPQPQAQRAPVLLYLHGARWNVQGSAARMLRLHALGFSVLAIDYRGFGKSTALLPSEASAYEDARAAWDWLAQRYPQAPRYVFGHSLGGAVAIELAAQVDDEQGTLVEGTFSSMVDVVKSMRWGWLPVAGLITQRFDSAAKVARIGSPLIVVHGENDSVIAPELGRKLFEAAREPKTFVLVKGGTHYNTNSLAQAQYARALAQMFGNHFAALPAPSGAQ